MMMDKTTALDPTLLQELDTRERCMAALMQVAKAYDLQHVSILIAPTVSDIHIIPLVVESTLPPEFAREFDRNQFLRHCPIARILTGSNVPEIWCIDEAFGLAGPQDWPLAMRELMLRHDLASGGLFPMVSVDSKRYLIRYDGQRAALNDQEIGEIYLWTLRVFDRMDRLRRHELSTMEKLSAREIEVVRWTAQGKTSAEIASILSLSDHTINAYMMSAIKKLDCVNRTQLIAKAFRMKLID